MEADRMSRSWPSTVWRLALLSVVLVVAMGMAATARRTFAQVPATSIISISVGECGESPLSGTVTLDGTFTGSITLGLFFHMPASPTFDPTGDTTVVTFSGTSSENYTFSTVTLIPGANSYRVEVIDADGLGGGDTKSPSIPACGVTPTPTPTPTSTPTQTPT